MPGEVEQEERDAAGLDRQDSTAESDSLPGSNAAAVEGVFGVETLWRIQINSIRDQIISGAKDYLEVANLAEHIGADYHGRFLVELIQNAEDPSRQTTSMAFGHRSTRLIIVRTETLVAVLNQGMPFTEKDIKAITSLGLSTKNPETSLGNKGVGFKAVFQVTDCPEIYSAPESGGNLWSEDANRFCMQEKPFADAVFMQSISEIVDEEMSLDPVRTTALEEHAGSEKANSYLVTELQRAAPFKFPKSLTLEDQENRIEELGIPRETVGNMSTMVVLPLLKRPGTIATVDAALNELTHSDHPGSTLLFLTGIGRLWVFDRVGGEDILLLRHERGRGQQLDHGIDLRDITTMERIDSSTGRERRKARWWLASRRFGRDGSDPVTSIEEEKRIAEAVESLRIATWKDVRSAYAGVALPRSPHLGENLRPLGADGIFCIGLPTHVRTGLPVWVNGPFHGHISRTIVDFKDQQYNRLILEEGTEIFWSALEYIKSLPATDDRRHPSLVLEPSDGPFEARVTECRELAMQKVVLDAGQNAYLSPHKLKVPEEDDIGAFDRYFATIENIEQYGFCLPDGVLLRNCWGLLEGLAGTTDITVGDSAYLQRLEGRDSLLETAAREHRGDGHEWWEGFLGWVVARFDFSDLQKQKILPVGSNTLAAATDRVFFRPIMGITPGEQSQQQDEPAETQSPEEIIDDLDETFLDDLAFMDEQCVQVRQQAGQRPLTDLARRLSPEQGAVLVRNPRRPEIINEVLSPYLARICMIPEEQVRALAMLAQIADWLHDMRPGPREVVNFQGIRVPVAGVGDQWDWVAPIGVYFGDGWLSHETDELIGMAYSEGASVRLPSLSNFQNLAGGELARDVWRVRFGTVGVLEMPRLISASTGRRVYLKANYNNRLSVEDSRKCPIPQAVDFWPQYLSALTSRPTEVKSGQPYYVRDPLWIDGIERDNARNAVIRLVLRNAEYFSGAIRISVEREHGVDARQMPSLWVHTVVSQQWPVIPTNLGPRAPSKAWRLDEEMQRTIFARDRLLAYVKPPYDQAVQLLQAVGVYSPTDAPVYRVVAELQDTAAALDGLMETSRRSTEALIRELYMWLQNACAREGKDSGSELSTITERPVPLLRGGEFVIVDLSRGAVVLLNDDAERLPYVKAFSTSFVLPLHARQSNVALYEALREVLGTDRVMRASEAEIILRFEQVEQDTPLLDYLVHGLESTRPEIRRDLAALIAFGGRPAMDPRKETFHDKWVQFHETNLRRGCFEDPDRASPVYDQGAVGGAALFVPSDHDPQQILEACWHLLGPSHQHAWENYVTRLRAGECDRFFNKMQLNDRDWIELESVIGASQRNQLDRLQPAFLALRRRLESDLGVERFRSELEMLGLDVDKIASWIGIESAALESALAEGSLIFDDERQLPVIETLGVHITDWQRARRDLGRKPVVFQSTIQSFEEWRDNIVAYLRTVFAREMSDIDVLEDASRVLKEFSGATCPNALAEQALNQVEITAWVVRGFQDVIDREGKAGTILARRLQVIESIHSISELSGQKIPRRELILYLNQSEHQRESDAKEAARDVTKVAQALAGDIGETIEEDRVLSDAAIAPWLQGYWANCFAALRALRELLRLNAPAIVGKLNEAGVFAPRQRVSWREQWKLFPELGEPIPTNRTAPPKQVEILGQQIVESELDNILGQGSDGVLGQHLANSVDNQLDMASLARKLRNPMPQPAPKTAGGRGGGGGGGGRKADPQAGLLGEAFVYESFRNTLPDFDVASWVSDSRRKYGLDGKGDDGLGYDFEYTDVEGKLTGDSNRPHCFIEVKSTVSTQNESFPMTANEWAVAEQCYKGVRKAQYIIVRVLGIKTTPVIADIIVDPVLLWHEGKLALENHDFIVRPAPSEPSGEGE